ncbi:MAG: C1 family peptidase [Arenicella sp.]
MPGNNKIKSAGFYRTVSVLPDFPDLRDRFYEPSLIKLSLRSFPEKKQLLIRNQKTDGACVGFALSAVINLQNNVRCNHSFCNKAESVSPRMLYEMAKFYDEWSGQDYGGSSLRGGIKGFFHNGVCTEALSPYKAEESLSNGWALTPEQAENARNVSLGAYYRLRPNIIDYHSAINEVGAIVVSANIHSGWSSPKEGYIQTSNRIEGGHAFAIVGYDADGFIIQNSWGDTWGGLANKNDSEKTPEKIGGLAHWSYEDWSKNIIDAWVLRLAVPTPKSFDLLYTKNSGNTENKAIASAPRRSQIEGHFIHIDDGHYVDTGRYATNEAYIKQVCERLSNNTPIDQPKHQHLLIYAHGGLNNCKDSAKRIYGMKDVFLRNGIYPIHLMWETGFTEELVDIFGSFFTKGEERVGSMRDGFDKIIEKISSGIGRKLWTEMKVDAERAFAQETPVKKGVLAIAQAAQESATPIQVHLVGHSAGSILLGELICQASTESLKVGTCHLLAPACSIDFYQQTYLARLKDGFIPRLHQYNLTDRREKDDVVGPYGKSLLYLVSRAFEAGRTKTPTPLLGMEKHVLNLQKEQAMHPNHHIFYAGKANMPTNSKTHGGFDNDKDTMNDLLKSILGTAYDPAKAFKQSELEGY